MVEGIMGMIGVLIGSIIAYYSQYKLSEQNKKYEELKYIKRLKLEKYEYILEDIRHEIRSYSFVSVIMDKILKYYENNSLTEDILNKELDTIKGEGNHRSIYLNSYDFLFNKKDLDLIKDSRLIKECIDLDLRIIPNVNMTNIKNVEFRRDMLSLSVKANSIFLMYVDLLEKIKLEMEKELKIEQN